MMPPDRYDGARVALVALLQQDGDPQIFGLSELSCSDQLFFITKCCATVLEHSLCMIARHHGENALEGLEALYQCMRINIEAQCKATQ
jgi:hypothetical protein